MIDAFDCDNDLLSDAGLLEGLLRRITDLLDMKILKGPEIAEGIPENPGLSAFAIIDFSHISIHTFTNSREFCLDIFSCKAFDYRKLEQFIKSTFNLGDAQMFKSIVRYDQLDIERGERVFASPDLLDEHYVRLDEKNVAMLDWYRDVYANKRPVEWVLDLSGGPSVHQLVAAADKAHHIVVANHSQANLERMRQWLRGENDYWDKFVEYSIGKGCANGRCEDLAGKISDFITVDTGHCDETLVGKFNVVQSNLCLECATDDVSEYKRSLGHIGRYLKPGGTLLMAALDGAIAHKVGDKYYPAIYLDKELVRHYLSEAGFRLKDIRRISTDDVDEVKYRGLLLVEAVRKTQRK